MVVEERKVTLIRVAKKPGFQKFRLQKPENT